ncbi:60S ribosomal protein L27 [Apodemus speciosus]|uniref:60S ribosomal protein L27 n=1 Tax=Apodemus speciosus TaxID=105296 RepID=A0ABQ0F764_APOSI
MTTRYSVDILFDKTVVNMDVCVEGPSFEMQGQAGGQGQV